MRLGSTEDAVPGRLDRLAGLDIDEAFFVGASVTPDADRFNMPKAGIDAAGAMPRSNATAEEDDRAMLTVAGRGPLAVDDARPPSTLVGVVWGRAADSILILR